MELFSFNANAKDYEVTLNGRPVSSFVFASEELGIVHTQEYPPGWLAGVDPTPPEKIKDGRVKITPILRLEFDE